MKIKVLGTRGEIPDSAPYHSKQSGVLIDNKLLLDIGDKRFLQYKPQQILITHLHPDHAFFTRRKRDNIKITIPLYAPEKYPGQEITLANRRFTVDNYRITPIPTLHSARVKSNAYLIEHNNKRILYTGDLYWIRKKYHYLLKNLDLVITEASFIRKGGMLRRKNDGATLYGHTGVQNLINLFKRFTNTILLVHFGSWFYENMPQARKRMQQLARENNIEIIVGYDGQELTI
jgi:ribonuclease BN (tRNA processing enzyme)